ncbi:hypothetical protein ACFVOK_20280 [Streptomyces sp. NPDC057798]|uniref:hypothetical protein n=1 Tax=Streptomyces sp. NPDC057798 TaxID=3346252 RepID=UPI0036C53EE2
MGGVDHPTYFRIDDALKTARAMNATVVRSHTLGTSLGCPQCIRNPGGGPVTVSLEGEHADGEGSALRAAYDPGTPGYAVIIRSLPAPQDWGGARTLDPLGRQRGPEPDGPVRGGRPLLGDHRRSPTATAGSTR